MLLQKIILENYGLYAGKVEIDLTPRLRYGQERPIILIGGNNGTGKTTFLDAIRLVLYGKAVLGDRVTQNDYEYFLRRQIHRSNTANINSDFARVAIEFDYITAGEKKTYFVERSWTTKKTKGVKEILHIAEDGKVLENIDSDFWQGFVEDIIPERLSQLFFFDGEKIKSIADDNNGSQVLADAIKTLLGMDIVDRLNADLTIYTAREIKKRGGKTDNSNWQNIETTIAKTKEEIRLEIEKIAGVRSTIDGVLADIKNKENRLNQEGHFYATRRDDLKNQQNQLAAQIEELENQIRSECEKTFPFALCPSISNMLRGQLNKEKEMKRFFHVQDELITLQNDLVSRANNIDKKIRPIIEEIIKTACASRLEKSVQFNRTAEVHGLSDATVDQIFGWLNEAENQSKPTVLKQCQLLTKLQRKLQINTKELEKSPDEAQTRPLFDDLAMLHQRLGEFHQKEKQIKADVAKKEKELINLQREQRRQIDRQIGQDASEGRLTRVRDIQKALTAYHKRLTAHKIHQLRQAVAKGFNLLSSKDDLISDITIDPGTFAITIYDNAGKSLPKHSLSAGEKQLFAVAMLWGLAKTSGRPLPVIIDTPLGRLDSDHRSNLIENYFPKASHQVILLSTDTEVDKQLYKKLSPNISHCYHLHYENELKRSEPREEYFWKGRSKCKN